MTNAKLFDKLRSLMAKADRADKKHIKKLRKVLHKLKDRQRELQEKLEKSESPQEQAKIQQEIDIIKLQRGKGQTQLDGAASSLPCPACSSTGADHTFSRDPAIATARRLSSASSALTRAS